MSHNFPKDDYVTIKDLRLHYRDWGGQGNPILLLHGLASHSGIWDLTAPLLAAQQRVVALELRGHGASDKPDHGYDFDAVAEDVMQSWSALGLHQLLLVGHSWGGNVALQCAVAYPNQVSGLVMVDGGFIEPSSIPGWTWPRAEVELAPPEFGQVTLKQVTDRIRKGNLAPYMNPEIESILASNFYQTPEGFAKPNLSRENHMKIVRALWDHKPSTLFPNVRCPALVLPARKPDANPSRGEIQAALVSRAETLLPNGRVIWMEDTIHDIPLQRPRELAQIILDFAQQPPTSQFLSQTQNAPQPFDTLPSH